MNGPQREVLKKTAENIDKLVGSDKDFIEYLAGANPNFRLKTAHRLRLFAIGRKVGIDGDKLFLEEVQRKQDQANQA